MHAPLFRRVAPHKANQVTFLVGSNASRTARHVTVYGERRSANRAKWAQNGELSQNADADDAPSSPSASTPSTSHATSIDIPSSSHLTPQEAVWAAAAALQPAFFSIDQRVFRNARRLQQAFASARIGPHHFTGSTGYGHGDLGREALDAVYASYFGAEAAMVRSYFMSGTHAIASALFAVLRPGDEMVAVAGKPYDTLEEVIGLRQSVAGCGSLMDWGIEYRELPLTAQGKVDTTALASAILPTTRVAHIQRSCGYSLRPTLTIAEIRQYIQIIKAKNPDCIVTVDNCYGEFVEEEEPTHVGADLCMGSLIKNGGGTIVSGGGYVIGREALIDKVAARLAAPGIGRDAGGVSGETMRLMFQGVWLAPQMTGEALKGGMLASYLLRGEGFETSPPPTWPRHDFITAIHLGSPALMVAFSKAMQRHSPIGSYVVPEPGVTAGYGDPVIFADGTFIDGATSELSADGPLREPYTIYCQGGNHWTHWAHVLEHIVASLRFERVAEEARRVSKEKAAGRRAAAEAAKLAAALP